MLKNRVAIVTGAASGMGYATSEALAREGAAVVMADMNEALLAESAAKIGGDPFAVDLSKREGAGVVLGYMTSALVAECGEKIG